MKTMKVFMIGAELHPFVKVGGLGDVMGSLPKALKKKKVDINIAIPFYKSIDQKKYKIIPLKKNIICCLDNKCEKFNLYQTELPGSNVKVMLIEHPFFNDTEVYHSKKIRKKYKHKYSRDIRTAERFTAFCKFFLSGIKDLNIKPDVIHCNDWQTGITPLLLKHLKKDDDFYNEIKVLYTIHNLKHQGITDEGILKFLMLKKKSRKYKKINLMKNGILLSDWINTVSPNYKKEILTKEFGAKLHKTLIKRKANLSGIINGIDSTFFDPSKDTYIKTNYNIKTISKKEDNKKYLLKKLKLKYEIDIPLFGLVSRLVDQKGIDILVPALEKAFKKDNFYVIILGTGKKGHEKSLKKLGKRYPEQAKSLIEFNVGLAQEIYAGSDIFLMPSLFEPCGLGQLISLRYGTLPLVRAVGGLKDTVKDNMNGFSFNKYSSRELAKTILRASEIYKNNRGKFIQMQKYGMKQDFSWDMSALEYIKLYKRLS